MATLSALLALLAVGSPAAARGLQTSAVESRALPTRTLNLKVAVLPDKAARDMLAGSNVNAKQFIDATFSRVKQNLNSLGVKFDLTWELYSGLDESFNPEVDDLKTRAYTAIPYDDLPTDANAYIVLTGTTGRHPANLAYTNAMCLPKTLFGSQKRRRVLKTSFVRIVINDKVTAANVVQALGWNLGMKKDETNVGPRYAESDGTTCTDVGGFMSPGGKILKAVKWTKCSKEDFEAYYDEVLARKEGPFCLEQAEGEQTTPKNFFGGGLSFGK